MTPFSFSIVTPDGTAYEGRPGSVTLAGIEGQLTVLARHAPMIAALRPGALTVREAGRTLSFATGSGVLEVRANATVALVDVARPA